MAFLTNSLCTTNQPISILSGTGSITIGSQSNTTVVITICNSFRSASNTSIYGGTGGLNLNAAGTGSKVRIANLSSSPGGIEIGLVYGQPITMGSTNIGTSLSFLAGAASTLAITDNTLGITTGTGTLSVSADSTANAVNIATGSGVKTLTLGSTNSTSATTIDSGTGPINIGTSIAKTMNIGNAIGATTVNIYSGTGDINMSSTDRITADSAGNMNLGALSTPTIVVGGSALGGNCSVFIKSGGSGQVAINTDSSGLARPVVIGQSSGLNDITINAQLKIAGLTLSQGVLSIDSSGIVTNGGTTVFSSGTGQLVVNANHIVNNGTLCTLTLPATSAVGTYVNIIGLGAGGWSIVLSGGRLIDYVATQGSTSLSSAGRYNSCKLMCVVADAEWVVVSNTGSLVLV